MSGAQQARKPKSRSGQRWPEIMVGAVTLALLAGFGTLVLGERNKPIVAQTPPPATPVIPASPGTVPEPVTPKPQVVTPPAAVQPDAPQTKATPAQPKEATPKPKTPDTQAAQTPAAQSPATQSPAAQKPPATSQALDPASSATAPTQTATPPATDSTPATPGLAQTSEIPPVPKAPPVEPIKPPVLPKPATPTPAQQAQTPAQQTPTEQPTTTSPAPAAEKPAEQPAAPATPAVPARAGGAVATSANRVPLRSDYRISLGSFSTRKTVESQTSGVRGLGYTVHAIDLGDQYVAQIGPFASEEAARQALADIQRAYPGALLYRPRNTTAENNNSTESNSSTTGSSNAASNSATGSTSATTPAPATSTAPATTPTRPQAAAPSGPAYIQVGAFDREESAQRLVGILHDNGFNPTVNSPEGRKTTVMVGPYSGDALLRAEARLDNAGLDHFRVR